MANWDAGEPADEAELNIKVELDATPPPIPQLGVEEAVRLLMSGMPLRSICTRKISADDGLN